MAPPGSGHNQEVPDDFEAGWTPDGPGGLENLVPQVVAVIVACDPGDWFEEALGAFAAQDYPELSLLVLDCGSHNLVHRVASVLPGAYVRWLGTNEGFGASANRVLEMVEGASHFLFCHDDVAPDPDAVSILVEESFRSNAGIVAPKFVSWEDPRRLLHVGLAADKAGGVVDRVEPGEMDHGQHDAVRDVFLVNGGFTLVRADLFAAIGGYDPQMFAMGEDLDLCWRAQVAGARVLIAPGARVRHLELLAAGRRTLPEDVRFAVPSSTDAIAPLHLAEMAASDEMAVVASEFAPVGTGAAGDLESHGDRALRRRRVLQRVARRRTEQVTLQSLQRRHELRAVLKDYSRFHRARVVPQVLALQVAEVVIAFFSGHRDRAAAVIHAWRWNLTERSSLRVARAKVETSRTIPDSVVRRLQLHGSARLNAFMRRVVTHGTRAAGLGVLDEIDDTRLAVEPPRVLEEEERRRVARSTRPARAVVWGVVALVLVFGTRELLGSGFPYVGQLLPFTTWSSFLHRFFSGWQPTGVGTVAPASPSNGLLGLGGLLFFGATGLLQKFLVLGCIPVGAFGMSRLVAAFGSVRARLSAAVVYLAIPLCYDALATARWDSLLVYAACPWIAVRLARASGCEPFDKRSARPGTSQWRRTVAGRALGLGILEALLTSFTATGAVLVLIVAAGIALGLLVARGRRSLRASGRVAAVALGATAVAAVLLEPWSWSVVSGPERWQTLFGLASVPSTGPTFGSLLHLGIGPIGDTPLAWGFVAAAALPLLTASRERLAWVQTAWVLALGAWAFAWASARGWLGVFRVPGETLLVPAALGMALAIGIGVASFETDLSRHRFGWRQAGAGLAGLFVVAGTIPTLQASASGHWGVPTSGYGQATSWMARETAGEFRVLWLGDPSVVPGGAWQISPGLSYELSEDGLGDATSLWPGAQPGAARRIGSAVRLVLSDETVTLGRMLAPYAVRYIVVVGSLAPLIPGSPSTVERAPPAMLLEGLSTQIDLRQVISEPGFTVFVDDSALPEFALHRSPATRSASTKVSSPSTWRPALRPTPGATEQSGYVTKGTLFAAVAPPSAWELVLPGGRTERANLAFGFGSVFAVPRAGRVTLRFVGSWIHGLEVWGEVCLWLVVLFALEVRKKRLAGWVRRLRARRVRKSRAPVPVATAAPEPVSTSERELVL